ncbi:hypothetical protein N7U66_13310 [Lacinutrix neustonica]|uniref:Uncharacterized protein n=1 Tax=Lacinutrix neustonica TaxID=2980107 RepID=A0A9E8MTH5_9FLAO|nr:hypothetical protein [Lacinutrix neustonica]WAC01133.1 hypothetical protein N7U66_13310 [Lacinutrix neustonica]
MLSSAFSCSVDGVDSSNYQEILPIESAMVPSEFLLNETYEITVTYLRPTSCHAFNNIYYQKHNNERTVAVITTFFGDNGNCTTIDSPLEATFNFKATQVGTYVFKFWQGEDDNGEDSYLIVEVPVTEE